MKTSGTPSVLKICLLMLMFVSYSDTYVFSKPRGGQVVSGNASFTQEGNLTVITAGNRSVINYQSFDIARGETVQFVQPGAHSTVLNRVTGSLDPTNIFGTLQSNGIVVIANPYGVFFQNGSVINVGGLIAGAGKVSAADFTHGKVRFTDLNGDVRNDGVIAADNRIALMGANVVNTGSLTSAHGVAMMVSGEDVYVGEKNGNVFVKANGRALQAQAARTGGGSAGSVTNSGTVAAPRVLLGAGDMYSTAIVNSGLLQGRSIAVNAGKNGSATVGGTLDATSARNSIPTGKGGKIDVTGGTVALRGAALDASGSAGGGRVRVGGDFHGDGAFAHAATTTVDAATTIKADATGATGDGGTVVLWSDQGTDFHGSISAQGNAANGTGGTVEVSSHGGLGFNGLVNANASPGKGGSLLLDPTNIDIVDGGTDVIFVATTPVPAGTLHVSPTALAAVAVGTLNVTASNDIRVEALASGKLTLNTNTIFTAGAPNAVTNANSVGSFVMDPATTIAATGHNVTINANGPSVGGTTGINGTSANAIEVTSIDTSSTTGAGGAVNLNINSSNGLAATAQVLVTGNLTAGSTAAAGGAITISGSAAANLPTSITTGPTTGGRLTSSATGAAGAGGAITLASSGPVSIGGAADASSSGAAGGAISLTGVGTMTTGNLLATSAVSTAAANGVGSVAATTTGQLTTNRIDTSSASGPGGAVTLLTNGAVSLTAANSSAAGAAGGAIKIGGTAGATTYTPASVTVTGFGAAPNVAAFTSTGTAGGAVTIQSVGSVGVTGATTTSGSTGAGGAVTVTNTNHTTAVDAFGAITTVTTSGTAGRIFLGSDGTAANLAPLTLTLNGALTATGVSGNGGGVRLFAAGAISGGTNTVSTTGGSSGAGGSIVASAGTGLTLGALDAHGTTGGGAVTLTAGTTALSLSTVNASSAGGAGGGISITAPGVTSGGLDSFGATGGGNVSITSAGGITVSSTINTASSGSGAGTGGTVNLITNVTDATATPVSVQGISTRSSGTGAAGAVTIGGAVGANLPTSLTLNSTIDARGLLASTGGAGGPVTLTTSGALAGGTNVIDTSSAAGAAGSITATSTGSIVTLGTLTANGAGTGAGGTLTATANGALTINGAINTSASGSGAGGAVRLLTSGTGATSTPVITQGITTSSGTGTGGAITVDRVNATVALPTIITVNGALITTGGAGNGPITLASSGVVTLTTTAATPTRETLTGDTAINGSTLVLQNAGGTTITPSYDLTGHNLALTLSGDVLVDGSLGGTAGKFDNVRNFTSSGAGSTTIDGSFTTQESQLYASGSTALAATAPLGITLTAGATIADGSITFGPGVGATPAFNDSADFAHAVTLITGTGSTGVTISQPVGTTHPFLSLTATGQQTNGSALTTSEPVTINAQTVAAGTQTYGSLTLGGTGATTLTSTLLAGSITSNGTVTGSNLPFNVNVTGLGGSSTFAAITGAGAVDFEVAGIAAFNGAITATKFSLGLTLTNPVATTTFGRFTVAGTAVSTSQGQTYNEEVYLSTGAIFADSGTAATVSFKGVDSFTPQALTVNASGTTVFGGALGALGALASVTTDAAGTTQINGGSVTTSNGAQLFNDAVTLGANTTLSAGSGAVTFGKTLESDSTVANSPARTLTINTTGVTTFGGRVGGDPGGETAAITNAPALASLSVVGGGTVNINGIGGTSVTTVTGVTGLQNYSGPVVLGTDTLFKGYGLTFSNGVTSGAQAGTPFNLTLDLFGPVTLPGSLSLTGIRDFASVGPGTVTINGNVTTTRNQTYRNGPVLIGGTNVTLTAGSTDATGSITLGSTVDDLTPGGGVHPLTLISGTSGGTTISGNVGGSAPLLSLTATARQTTGQTTTADQPVTINGVTIKTTGSQSYGTLILGGTPATAQTTLTSTGGTGVINSGAVTGNGHPLQVNTTGTGSSSTFAAITGAGAVDFEVGGIATFNGAITATSFSLGTSFTNPSPTTTRGVFNAGGMAVQTTGGQTYGEEVYLGAGTIFADGTSAITFNKGVDSATATAQALTVNTGGVTTFGGLVGAINALASVTTDAAGSTQINGGGITTTAVAGQVFHDDVTLGANTTLNAGTGAVTFDKTLASAITPHTLTINTSGLTTFTGQVGGTSTTGTAALGSLTTSTGEVDIATGITTLANPQGGLTGDQTYGGVVHLTGNTTLQGHTLTLATAGLLGQGHDLLLNFTTQVTLRNTSPRAITGVGIFETDGAGGVLINDAFSTAGTQTYKGGPVSLAGTPSLTSTNGSIVFNVPVDGTAASVPLALSATSVTGQVIFNGSATAAANALVGNGTALGAFTSNTGNGTIFNMNAGLSTSGNGGLNAGSVSITGPVTFNEAGSTLTTAVHPSILTSGSQVYSGPATLGQDTSLVSGGGTIAFNSAAATINSASGTLHALNTSTAGTQTFTGLIGNAFALGGLTTGSGATVFNMVIPSTNLTLYPAGVRVSGPVTISGPITLNVGSSSLTQPSVLTLGNGNQTYGSTVTLAGPITVLNSANTESPLGTFNGGGTITFNGNIIASAAAPELDVRAGVGTVEFDQAINIMGDFAPGGASVIFRGTIGTAANQLGIFTVLPNNGGTGTPGIDLNGGSVITGGTQTYAFPTVLSANTILQAGVAGGTVRNITFGSTLDGSNLLTNNPYTLNLSVNGGIIAFNGIVGGIVPLASLTTGTIGTTLATTQFNMVLPTLASGLGGVNVLGAVTINTNADFEATGSAAPTILSGVTYNGVTGTGTQTYGTVGSAAAVTVGTNTVLRDLAATGSITFNGKIDARTDGVAGLSVNAVGDENFGQLVGNTNRLASLSTDDLGTVGGTANFNMNLTAAGTLAGVRTTGQVNINDRVNFNATGGTTLPTILSGAAQNYAHAATVTQDAVLTATGGDITFAGAVNSATTATPRALTVNTPGNEIFQGLVGSSAPLLSLSTDATGTVGGQAQFVTTQTLTGLSAGVGGVNTTGAVTVKDAVLFQVTGTAANHPSIVSGGTQTYAQAATLGAATILTSTGGSIVFNGTVDSDTSTTFRDLTTNTPTVGSFVTFAQLVGSIQPLASLTTNGAGTTQINGGSVTTAGNQEYLQSVTLGQNTQLFAPGASIDFARSLDGAFNLETNSANASFRAVGNTAPLVNLTVNAPGSILFTYDPTLVTAGNAGVNLYGQLNVNGPAVFDATGAGSVVFVRTGLPFMGGFVASGQSYLKSFTLAGTAAFTDNHGGDITFFQTVDGLSSTSLSNLTVSTDGTISFRGTVGATPLTSLTTASLTPGSGRTIFSGGSVVTVNRGTAGATGVQTYNDAVFLGSDMVFTSTPGGSAATGGDITFARTLDSNATATPQTLTVNTSGRTIFGGAVGAANALATLTTDYEGASDLGTSINGGSVRTTGAQTYNDAVILGAAATLTSSGGGDIKFVRTLDSNATATPQALTVNTGGTTIFGGAVGATFALASVTTDVAGTTQINGGSVTTVNNGVAGVTGAQTYNDAVTLVANTVLRSNVSGAATVGGALTFNGTVDGGFDLTLNTSGLTIFNQPVGNTTALTALTTNAAGATQFNMSVGATAGVVVAGPVTINDAVTFNVAGASLAQPTVLTLANGNQTYYGAATLTTSTYLVSAAGPGTGGVYTGGGSVFFNSAAGVSSFGAPLPVDLYVRAGLGDGNIAGAITARDVDLGGALVNFAGPINLSGTFSVEPNDNGPGGSVTFAGGTVTTVSAQTYNTALILGSNTVLASTGGDITFNGAVDGAHDLAVNTPGNETFNGPVGNRNALLSLTTDAAGAVGGRVIFGYAGTTAAPSVTTVNAQTYNDAATVRVDTTLASTAGGITFAQTIDSAANTARALTLNAAGNETFNGQVGGTNPLASLVTDDATGTISGGQTIFNVAGGGRSVTTTGLQTYNDAVTLQAATNLTSLNNGALTFASTVNGPFALSLNTTGVTTVRGAVGGSAALASLSTQTGEVDLNGGTVTTTGTQNYGGAVTLGADTTLTSTAAGGGITFGSTLNSDGTARVLTISSVGPTRLSGVVGGGSPLASLTTLGAGAVAINGGAVTTVGFQRYGGAVTLGADTTLTSTAATGGGITFASTLGSDAAQTPRALTIRSVGPTRFAGVVGGNNLPLASLTTLGAGAVAINGGAITTTGTQNYGGAVTLGADTLLRSTGQGIVFNATVDSDPTTPRTLTLDAPGDEVFGGSVGGTAPLLTLTTTNTGRVVFGINGVALGVTTTGAQTYNNLAILQAGTTLTSTSGGNLTFASTVDSAANTPYALTLNTAGDEIFSDSVGSFHPLLSVVTDSVDGKLSGGHTYFGLQTPGQTLIVSTTGQQRYNDSVILRANLFLASTNTAGDNGALVFGSTVDSGKGDYYALTLNTPGDEVFNGLVGSGKEIGNLFTDAAGAVGGTVRFNMKAADGQNGVNVRGTVLIKDRVSFNPAGQGANAVTIRSTGTQTYADAATVAANTVLTSTGTGADGAITFNATVNGPAGLTLNTGGPTLFRGAIGGNNAPLGSLVVNGGGTITFNGQVVNTTGLQTYTGPVTLGQSTAFSNTSGDITFAGTVTGPYDLSVTTADANSSTVFEQSVNVNTFLAADDSAVVLAGGNVTTAGLQTYGGALTVTTPGPDGDRTVLTAPANNGGDRSDNGIIFKQDVNVQAGSLVALGYRILSGRQSDITVNNGDLVLNASNLLVLQGNNYLSSGRVILNDAVNPTYTYADYVNGERSQPSPTIYVLNAGRTTTFRGSSFDMGYLQNMYSVGSVAITAVGGGNATLSDIAAAGSLSVTAGSITLRARDPDPTRSNGSDDGLNFVAGSSINFGQSPINYTASGSGSTNNHANLVTPTGQVTVNRNQINGVSLFQDPTVRTRFASAQDIGFRFDGAENVSNLFGNFGSFLQLTSSGAKTQEIAAALSGALPDQKPLDVASDLTVTASQMEELKKLGIHPRTAQKQERLSLASKRALFAQLVDGLDTDNYGRLQPVKGGISRLVPSDYVVVVDRMSEREVQAILTAFEELYGKNKEKAPPIGEAFNTAFTDYSTEKQTADAAGFAPYLSAKPGKYPDVDKAVRGFDNLFGYIESLGLTPKEQAKSKEHIASDLQVSGVSAEDMVKVIDTLRTKIPKDQKAPSTKLPPSPPASNPAPGATNPPPPEQKKGTPPLKTARQGQKDRRSKTVRQNQPKAGEDRLHEVAGL